MSDAHPANQRACAICESALDRELLRISEPDRFERHLGIARDGYVRTWIECSSCGAATNVHASGNRERLDSLAAGYYEVDFAGSSIGDKFAKVIALPPERSDNAQRVARIHSFLEQWLPTSRRGLRALDIGAGTGVFLWRFLEEAEKDAWTATAVEPDAIAAAHLRSLDRFPVIEGLFSQRLGLLDFDLVTLNKVVEHLADPVGLVKEAASALRTPAGVLYVEVPDKLTVYHRPPTDNILGALHFHLYDPVSIAVLLSRAGLATLRIDRIFDPSGKITIAAFATLDAAIGKKAATGAPE
jgi:SAM-dependent methyltransferase